MNYLSKCVVSAIISDIYNNDSYELGKIVGQRIKLLESGNVEGANITEFLKGIQEIANENLKTDNNETIS